MCIRDRDVKSGSSLEEAVLPPSISFSSPHDYKNVRIYPLSENIILEFPLDGAALPDVIQNFLRNLLSCDDGWIAYSDNSYIPLIETPPDILELLKNALNSISKD